MDKFKNWFFRKEFIEIIFFSFLFLFIRLPFLSQPFQTGTCWFGEYHFLNIQLSIGPFRFSSTQMKDQKPHSTKLTVPLIFFPSRFPSVEIRTRTFDQKRSNHFQVELKLSFKRALSSEDRFSVALKSDTKQASFHPHTFYHI